MLLRCRQRSAFHELYASGHRHKPDLHSSRFARSNAQRPPLGLQAVEFRERTAQNGKLPFFRRQKRKPEAALGIRTRAQDVAALAGNGSSRTDIVRGWSAKLLAITAAVRASSRTAPNGKQKDRCKDCGKASRANPGAKGYPEERKEEILRGCQERSSLRGLSRTFGGR